MGLHCTPYGTFFVLRSLHSGKVLKVLPVVKPPMPSRLPSVEELGITAEFIARRRQRLEDDCGKAAAAQQRLQDELARAGGGQLLETGRAVLERCGNDGPSPSLSLSLSPPPPPPDAHDPSSPAAAAAAAAQQPADLRFVHEVFTQTEADCAAAAALANAVQGPSPVPVAGFAEPEPSLHLHADGSLPAGDMVVAHKHWTGPRPNKGKGRAQF